MQEAGIFQNYTIKSLLDKLDIIEYFEHPGYDPSGRRGSYEAKADL